MVISTSYRLDERLKNELAEQAQAEGLTETALVSRLLDEGLTTAAYPGIIYRGGPGGRRAALAGGPDVAEVVAGLRHAPGNGDAKVVDAAEQMGIPERMVRLAVSFAAAHSTEIEDHIARNQAAAEQAKTFAERRSQLLGKETVE